MPPQSRFVSGGSVRAGALASAFLGSLILEISHGWVVFIAELYQSAANFLSAGIDVARRYLVGLASAPGDDFTLAFGQTLDIFPLAGPFDWAIAVGITAAFFGVGAWTIGKAKEAFTG